MSPVHREPPRREETRSFWTTTWIFVTLVVLTAMMAFFVKELVTVRPTASINASK